MQTQAKKIVTAGIIELNKATDLPHLELIKSQYLGKTGALNTILKTLGKLPSEKRKRLGQVVNTYKKTFQEAYLAKKKALEKVAWEMQLRKETIDITLPGRGRLFGGIHPISQVQERMVNIFASLGFDIASGPEIEDDYHCFEALNIPQNHPARAMQDTFYLDNGLLLRPHTSSMQVRYMENHPNPPIRVVGPGTTYRVDSDATHSPMFHQLEGLWVEENVSFVDLKSLIIHFLHAFFEKSDLQIRFRASFFPFTEPSAEVDIKWENKWLECAGCGMVHPQVLENIGINSEKYTGLAFGLGIDRYAMLYYGVTDLRLFFDNDLAFLNQFN